MSLGIRQIATDLWFSLIKMYMDVLILHFWIRSFCKNGKDRNNLHISVFTYPDRVRWGHLDGVIIYRSKLAPFAHYSKKGNNSECKKFQILHWHSWRDVGINKIYNVFEVK